MNNFTLTTSSRVGDIVAAKPLLASVFETIGIDYCCRGKSTLDQACRERQLDPKTVLTVLASLPAETASTIVDVGAMTLTALADHIETTHHAYLKNDLPILAQQAERVAVKHGYRDKRFLRVSHLVHALRDEMLLHMEKEEKILFPWVRDLEGDRSGEPVACASISHPIAQMEHEHADAGAMLEELRVITDGFTPPVDACNTHRALLAGLAFLEKDLHAHVHKENNVMFPRALALEQSAHA